LDKKVIKGNIIDVIRKEAYLGKLYIENGFIQSIDRVGPANKTNTPYILPGFIDAHVHVESSMLIPSEFARLAVVHGTVAAVSDPHEIGNVMGVEGVDYMINNGKKVPFKFYFGAPSCVPATAFETAGAEINSADIKDLLAKDDIVYLAEMMNWPGVLSGDKEVYSKIKIAQEHNKPVDGHAPGLMGDDAIRYIKAGISTDHECFTEEEARHKLNHGMKVIIREGSAAKNFDALIGLLDEYYQSMMFCSDDKHPDNLVEGHINLLVKRALNQGIDLYKVLTAACVNPVMHYGLNVGLLRPEDPADFIIIDDLNNLNVKATYIDGSLVSDEGKTKISPVQNSVINNFNTSVKSETDFATDIAGDTINVISAEDGQLVTNKITYKPKIEEGKSFQSSIEDDILKISVVNRYSDEAPAIGFIKNFGLKEGAIASSVGHDSHNIIAVGVDDVSIAKALNLIIEAKGGISAVSWNDTSILELPVGGIMSTKDGYQVAEAYKKIDKQAKIMGSNLESPYMTLSFMALLVIPEIKLSDKGLFDGNKFDFIPLSY